MRADLQSVQVVCLADGDARALHRRLEELDCSVAVAPAGEYDAEHVLREKRPDLIVVEGAVVREDFLVRARRIDRSCGIVAWLPKASSSQTAHLLGLGVDEVVHEGMGEAEFGARLAAALGRLRARGSKSVSLGSLSIDDQTGEASWAGQDLSLTRREREVLHALADSVGKTLPREVLYKQVWGYAMARGDRSVDVNVKRLRAKLARHAGDFVEIKTQPGIGYRLEVIEQHELSKAVTTL